MMAAAATMNPLAAEAWRLRCRGLPEAQIAERPLPATRVLIGLGSSLSAIDDARLTPSEIALLLTIAKVARDDAREGVHRSIETYRVACRARRSRGWPTATARKRLLTGSNWSAERRAHEPKGIGAVTVTGNGYIALTTLGWMIVQAIETGSEGCA